MFRPVLLFRCAALHLTLGSALALLPAASPAALPPEFAQALARAGVPTDAVSVMVTPVPGAASALMTPVSAGRAGAAATPPPVRLSHRADASMNPASVMKLITTYAGLDLLGTDFTWTNRVYVDGPVTDGVLDGNLIIRGSGDPKLVLERVDALLRQVMAQGVREVRGDIVLDRSIFQVPERHPGAFDDEPLRPYNASPDGLLVNFKSLVFTFTPDPARAQALIRSEPPIAGVEIPASPGAGIRPLRRLAGWPFAPISPAPTGVRFAGRYPAACGERLWPVAYVEPRAYAARVVQAMWDAAGGRLQGRVREGTTPAAARLWVSADSLPMGDIVADINKFSNNVMAQQLFLTFSSQEQGRGTFEGSRQRLQRWWRERFGEQAAPVLDNGSGLSLKSAAAPAALTALLRRAASGPLSGPFTVARHCLWTARWRACASATPPRRRNAWLKSDVAPWRLRAPALQPGG
jgi:D-alanyl-D-alanine carboxypeptidase/D-alanyl-D-alanine-endopeptidase (penicillin-binding protein 4)